jgi:hypothetical protein
MNRRERRAGIARFTCFGRCGAAVPVLASGHPNQEGLLMSTTVGSGYVEERRGYGWVAFAGTMLCIVGTMNVIYGIGAISDSKFFAHDVKYVFGSLNAWGWAFTITGAIQVVSALGIWAQARGARWVGILTAMANAAIQMLSIPAYPLLAVTLFAIDIAVMYGLIAHGRAPRA